MFFHSASFRFFRGRRSLGSTLVRTKKFPSLSALLASFAPFELSRLKDPPCSSPLSGTAMESRSGLSLRLRFQPTFDLELLTQRPGEYRTEHGHQRAVILTSTLRSIGLFSVSSNTSRPYNLSACLISDALFDSTQTSRSVSLSRTLFPDTLVTHVLPSSSTSKVVTGPVTDQPTRVLAVLGRVSSRS